MCEQFLEDVLLDYRQRCLPSDQVAALERHLTDCPSCQAALRDVDIFLASTDDGAVPELSLAGEERVQQIIHRAAVASQQRAARFTRWARLGVAVAAGIMLAAGVTLAWLPRTPDVPPVVATVVDTQPGTVLVRNGQEQVAEKGMVLRRHDTLNVRGGGSAVLAVGSARADLGPDTTVVLAEDVDRSMELRLDEGFLGIETDSRPMKVRTAVAEAVASDTTFTIGAHDRNTTLRVAEGRVSLTRMSDGATVDVPAGNCSRVADQADLAPSRSRTGTVLQIVSDDARHPQWRDYNRLIREQFSSRLWRLGFRVETRDHRDVVPADLVNRPLVIVSVFAWDSGAQADVQRVGLADAQVPVLCLEPDAYSELGMTGPKARVDFGFEQRGLFVVDFPNPDHPLSRGMNGQRVELFHSRRGNIGWGRPTDAAVVAAQLTGQPEKAVLFGYDTRDPMVQRLAPARRVGLFLDPDQAREDARMAWTLVAAAVEWSVQARP